MAPGKEFLITDRREPSPNVKIEEDERYADALGILIWLRFSSMIEKLLDKNNSTDRQRDTDRQTQRHIKSQTKIE